MRKKLLDASQPPSDPEQDWLDLARLASAELTSEDRQHPIEAALDEAGSGWRAAAPGRQTIRLTFDAPQRLERIRLRFEERDVARTQEFCLSWSPAAGSPLREIVRQQYTFSPPDTAVEVETYEVSLPDVAVLELALTPDIDDPRQGVASVAWLAAS